MSPTLPEWSTLLRGPLNQRLIATTEATMVDMVLDTLVDMVWDTGVDMVWDTGVDMLVTSALVFMELITLATTERDQQ